MNASGGENATDWRKMKALAEANATAEINIEVPKPYYFKDDPNLLKPPSVRDGDLPWPPWPAGGAAASSDCASSWARRSAQY